jgi:hypothetical protein
MPNLHSGSREQSLLPPSPQKEDKIMNMKNLLAACLFCGFALTLSAQQPVAPPPKPANDAPVAASAASGLSLAETMKFIQEKLKEQGLVEFVETVSVQNQPGVTIRISVRSKDDDVVADPATCTLHAAGTYDSNTVASAGGKTVATEDQHSYLAGTLAFKDVEKITVEHILDFFNRHVAESGHPEFTATAATPVFFVELSAAKTLFTRHETKTIGNKAPVVTEEPLKEAGLVFRDEETANRVAKAITHAVELCGGGNKDKF